MIKYHEHVIYFNGNPYTRKDIVYIETGLCGHTDDTFTKYHTNEYMNNSLRQHISHFIHHAIWEANNDDSQDSIKKVLFLSYSFCVMPMTLQSIAKRVIAPSNYLP